MIRLLIGQAVFVTFSFLAFVSLCGAAVTIGELGVPHPHPAKIVRMALIAATGSFVFFGVGYFGRRMIIPRSKV